MKILLIVYDNESYIHHTPIGMAYLASALIRGGHEVSVYSQDLYHWPESHLTEHLTRNRYDVVGLGFVGGYYPYRKFLKISQAINSVPNRPYYVIGGHGPSPEPEYFLRKGNADCVVVGEGEVSILNLLDALEHKKSLGGVNGIAYLEGNRLVQTPRQPLIQDIDSIPIPDWSLFPMNYYALYRIGNIMAPSDRVALMISGRGCPFSCNFCYRMDEGVRVRSPENIIEEIKLLQKDYNINFFQFQDELFMTSIPRIEAVCEALLRANLGIKWGCNGRLNYAKPDVLRLMKRTGCKFINYGIESVDDNALRAMNKALTVKQITSGVEATQEAGITPGFNIIWGNLGDTKQTLQQDVDFLLKYDDQGQMRTIRPVTPYPGSPLYYHALKTGLLKDCADFYESKHINQEYLTVNFDGIPDEEFHKALCGANTALLANYYDKQKKKAVAACYDLYSEKTDTFRGFRQS